jgi:hypothetical protein
VLALLLCKLAHKLAIACGGCCAADPGNYSAGLEVMDIKNNGSFFWPTINGQTGSTVSAAAGMWGAAAAAGGAAARQATAPSFQACSSLCPPSVACRLQLYTANSFLRVDDPKCSPETTEVRMCTIRSIY